MIKFFVQSNFKALLIAISLVLLFCWSVLASVMAFKKENHVLVIRVDGQGTETLSEDKVSDRFSQDRINLSYSFINSHYSYNEKTYDSQKSKSLELFSKEVFKTELGKALSEKKEVLKRSFNQEAIIENYYLRSNNVMELEVLKTILERNEKPRSVKSRIFLSLSPIGRVKENPYGYEISKIKEVKRY